MLRNTDEHHVPTFRECAEEWFRELRSLDRARSTLDSYERNLNLHVFPHIADLPIDELTPRRIREVLDAALEDGLSRRTLGVVRATISGPCRTAYENGYIDHNPIHRVRSRRSQRKEVIPPQRVVVRAILELAEQEGHYLFPFLHLLAYTGIRRSEAMGLRWEHVSLDGRRIQIAEGAVKVTRDADDTDGETVIATPPKSHNSFRIVFLDKLTVAILRKHKARQSAAGVNSELVFPRPAGDFLRPTTIYRHLKELGARAGFPEITFHKFRHYHASEMLELDHNGLATSRKLGHSSIEVTMDIYGHMLDGRQEGLTDAVAEKITGGRASGRRIRPSKRPVTRRRLKSRGPDGRRDRRRLA